MQARPPSPDDENPQRQGTRRSYPLIRAVFAQLAAAAVMIGAQKLLAGQGDFLLPLPLLLALQGLLAAGLGHIMGLARWWLLLNLAVPAAVALALSLNLPGWIYPLLFAALALVFWNSADDRVPLYLTNRTTWQALQGLIAAELDAKAQSGKTEDGCDPSFRVTDIGCGLGGALLYLARHCPDAQFTGIESAPLPFAIARIRAALSGLPNLTIRYGDLWKQDLSSYDVVYCFLSPEPMPRLCDKAKHELRPGKLLISNSFAIPGVPAEKSLTLEDRRKTELLLYRF